MKIRAFHGLRFSGDAPQAGSLAAPPYDQVDEERRDAFHRTPGHFVHLTCPVPGTSGSAHENSAHLHREWQAEGRLLRDDEPGLYLNTILTPRGGVRHGLTALVDIEPSEAGVIRPHELTVEKTVEERLGLLRTTGIDYEPILLLSEDRGELEQQLTADYEDSEPHAVHRDEDGNVHESRRITGSEQIRAYRSILDGAAGLIADGHHRYRTAGLFAREIDAVRGTGAAAKLAVITSLESSSLTIDPIHRAFPQAVSRDAVADCILRATAIEASTGGELASTVAEAASAGGDSPALALLTAGEAQLLELDPACGPDSLPRAASDLAVVLLHSALLPGWGFEAAAATDGTLAYRSDVEVLWRQVMDGTFPAGIVLPPMTAPGFAAAIANGDVLPPKSTRFLPKVVSGLVWADHRDPVF